MSEQEIPDFPDWICLEWKDGRRIRIDMHDVGDVVEDMKEIGCPDYISPEQFGAFVAALQVYADEAEA